MAINESILKMRIRSRGISSTDISDDDLDVLIDDALEQYSAYRPNLTFTGTSGWLVSVAGQPSYDFPTGAQKIISVFWNPDYSDSYINDIYGEMLLDILDAEDTIEMTIQYTRMAEMRRLYRGSWDILNGKIWLSPPPGINNIKIPVLYATQQTLSTLNQIDNSLFIELVYCKCIEHKAVYMLSQGGWKAGAYSVTPQAGISLQKYAEQKTAEVMDRLARASGRDGSIAGYPNEVTP